VVGLFLVGSSSLGAVEPELMETIISANEKSMESIKSYEYRFEDVSQTLVVVGHFWTPE
jgi:hypothetical protein